MPSSTDTASSHDSGYQPDAGVGGDCGVEADSLDSLLASLLRIREFETALLDLFSAGELNGTTHTCLGQEHVPVALMPLLHEADFIFSNHRGHGHYLARFGDYHGLLAEIMGRETGVCRGVGGSQHIRRGRYFSTGIQGESVPIATGCAWQLKREAEQALAVAFIGDGTWGQGAVYEALNMAALWTLPLVIVVENNAIAQSTPVAAHLAGSIEDRVRAFGINHLFIDGVDVIEIRKHVLPELDRVRDERRPLVIEFEVARLGPHSKGDDTRDADELARLRAHSWEQHYRQLDGEQFEEIESLSREFIGDLIEHVKGEALSTWQVQ